VGGRTASFIFFAARGGIRGSKDKVGGVGSHDLNWLNGQLVDRVVEVKAVN
jgi:hypothetical protein